MSEEIELLKEILEKINNLSVRVENLEKKAQAIIVEQELILYNTEDLKNGLL